MGIAMKLWAGRFHKELDDKVNDFNSSISFDSRMFREDITGSMAHAAMLAKQGIISAEDSAAIQEALYISAGTANTHMRHIYRKLDVHSQHELIDLVESMVVD